MQRQTHGSLVLGPQLSMESRLLIYVLCYNGKTCLLAWLRAKTAPDVFKSISRPGGCGPKPLPRDSLPASHRAFEGWGTSFVHA